MIKNYIKAVSFLALLSVMLGFVIPSLVSAKDSGAVVAGIVLLVVAVPVAIIAFAQKTIRLFKAKEKE